MFFVSSRRRHTRFDCDWSSDVCSSDLAATMAAVTQNAAIASLPHGPQAKVKHLDLVSLEPTEVLVILLVEGNLLRQHVMSVRRTVDQAELSRLANKLNRELAGKDRDDLSLRHERLGPGLEKE